MVKKKKPDIRFKAFTGMWEQRQLGEIYEKVNEKNDLSYGTNKIISVANMYFKSEVYISDKEYLRTYNIFKLGDIAFEGNKSKDFLHGRFVENTIGNGIVSHVFDVFRPKVEFDLQFWKYAINNECIMKNILMKCTKASTMMTNLVASDFLKENFNIPLLDEQKKIGVFFKYLDKFINIHKCRIKKLQNIKKAMIEKMFPKESCDVPEIRFKGFTDTWKQYQIDELGEVVTGSTPSTQVKEYYSEDGIPWVTPTDIVENITFFTAKYLSKEGQKVARIVPKDTILVTSIASIGKNTILGTLGSFNQQINGLVPNENNPYFLFTESLLWSEKMKRSAAAGTMQIINKTEFSKIITNVPSLEEQEKIGTFFKYFDSLTMLYKYKLKKLQDIKKFCLKKMFV